MQIPVAPPTNLPCTVDMAPSMHESTVEPSTVAEQEIVLVEDSDDSLEHNHDENQWEVSPPHPSEFVEPPPPCPVYYVITIGEEAGIYDSTWAETFNIHRVSRLEQFSLHVFHNWHQAHVYYTEQYELNHIANAPGNSDRTPAVAPTRLTPLVTNPRGGLARAQSAPPSMSSAVTGQSANGTQALIGSAPGYGSLTDCGSPNRLIYVQSNWPTPAVPRPESPVALLPPVVVTQPGTCPVGSQPAVPNAPHCLLSTIAEEATRPQFPRTQLHFDQHSRLIHPVATSVSSNPEGNVLPPPQAPCRVPQPFPLIPDPDFFTYPNINAAAQASGDRKPGTTNPESDSEEEEAWAKTLFRTGITPSNSASATKGSSQVVASSSNIVKGPKKRCLPTTPTSKPPKVCKTVSARKPRAMSEPFEDSVHGPDWMYLPDPK